MKYIRGVVHARNAGSDKYKFWESKCIPYINQYKKNRLKYIQKREHIIPDEYDKRDVQSHLIHFHTDLYMQLRIGRVKKSVIRKMFNYWYKVLGAYLNSTEFVDYDILSFPKWRTGMLYSLYYFLQTKYESTYKKAAKNIEYTSFYQGGLNNDR